MLYRNSDKQRQKDEIDHCQHHTEYELHPSAIHPHTKLASKLPQKKFQSLHAATGIKDIAVSKALIIPADFGGWKLVILCN